MKTEVARVELSCGSFDALRAVEFTSCFPPHFHDTFAIGVIESGATRLRTPRGEWIGRAGTILAFSPSVRRAYDARVVETARDFLDSSFAQPIRLQTLADHCAVSANHRAHLLRAVSAPPANVVAASAPSIMSRSVSISPVG